MFSREDIIIPTYGLNGHVHALPRDRAFTISPGLGMLTATVSDPPTVPRATSHDGGICSMLASRRVLR
eukprot:6195682-Pleurochrysis_carterae.AAC.2